MQSVACRAIAMVALMGIPFRCETFPVDRLSHVPSLESWATSANFETVTAPLMPLHVAPYTEGLAAASMGALERFLPRVGVAVDPETAWSAKCLVAGLAYVSVLALGIARPSSRVQIMMVLPWVRPVYWDGRINWWRERLGKCSLIVETGHLRRGRDALNWRIVGVRRCLVNVGRRCRLLTILCWCLHMRWMRVDNGQGRRGVTLHICLKRGSGLVIIAVGV